MRGPNGSSVAVYKKKLNQILRSQENYDEHISVGDLVDVYIESGIQKNG